MTSYEISIDLYEEAVYGLGIRPFDDADDDLSFEERLVVEGRATKGCWSELGGHGNFESVDKAA